MTTTNNYVQSGTTEQPRYSISSTNPITIKCDCNLKFYMLQEAQTLVGILKDVKRVYDNSCSMGKTPATDEEKMFVEELSLNILTAVNNIIVNIYSSVEEYPAMADGSKEGFDEISDEEIDIASQEKEKSYFNWIQAEHFMLNNPDARFTREDWNNSQGYSEFISNIPGKGYTKFFLMENKEKFRNVAHTYFPNEEDREYDKWTLLNSFMFEEESQ